MNENQLLLLSLINLLYKLTYVLLSKNSPKILNAIVFYIESTNLSKTKKQILKSDIEL